jgi:hypothetical protein
MAGAIPANQPAGSSKINEPDGNPVLLAGFLPVGD